MVNTTLFSFNLTCWAYTLNDLYFMAYCMVNTTLFSLNLKALICSLSNKMECLNVETGWTCAFIQQNKVCMRCDKHHYAIRRLLFAVLLAHLLLVTQLPNLSWYNQIIRHSQHRHNRPLKKKKSALTTKASCYRQQTVYKNSKRKEK